MTRKPNKNNEQLTVSYQRRSQTEDLLSFTNYQSTPLHSAHEPFLVVEQ